MRRRRLRLQPDPEPVQPVAGAILPPVWGRELARRGAAGGRRPGRVLGLAPGEHVPRHRLLVCRAVVGRQPPGRRWRSTLAPSFIFEHFGRHRVCRVAVAML